MEHLLTFELLVPSSSAAERAETADELLEVDRPAPAVHTQRQRQKVRFRDQRSEIRVGLNPFPFSVEKNGEGKEKG